MECLSTFIGHIYHSFNNKQFFVATSIDIRGAFDSVNISTLISHLLSLHAPKFCNTLFSLFNHLFFSSPFGLHNIRSTFTGLPQGSCLSPLLYIYMSIIEEHLTSLGHQCLIYADDLWLILLPINLLILLLNTLTQLLKTYNLVFS